MNLFEASGSPAAESLDEMPLVSDWLDINGDGGEPEDQSGDLRPPRDLIRPTPPPVSPRNVNRPLSSGANPQPCDFNGTTDTHCHSSV